MEINQPDVEIPEDELPDLISACVKLEKHESESNDAAPIINKSEEFCSREIKEGRNNSLIEVLETSHTDDSGVISLTLNSLDVENAAENNSLLSLQTDLINEEIGRRMCEATEIFINNEIENEEERVENFSYNVTDFLQLDKINSLEIKKEDNQRWLCLSSEEEEGEEEIDSNNSLDYVISKRLKDNNNHRILEIPIENILESVNKRKGRTRLTNDKLKRRLTRRKVKKPRQDYKERLRRKAECMREKRRKLHEQETEEERLERLAKEAAKRREMRMYYETPEQRRKRLDAEAARKREYRMYNETPEERRKRLDREAERRRIKRLTLYANETAEQRRERLNRESAKRREARLNQYSKETEDQRRERLRKDALRAREMRFTRSAIETEEERRQRLVKDALRKRELRTHGHGVANNSTSGIVLNNFTELQNVRSFEELNNVQMRDDPDNQLGSHYLSNWMMWFQNTLTQPVHIGEQTIEPQSQNNG